MTPTWDLVLVIFVGASLVYGFLMGRDRVVVTLLGAYVGLVIANQWAARALNFVTEQSPFLSDELASENLSIFLTKLALFIGTILVIVLMGGFVSSIFTRGNTIINLVIQLIYSFLSATLIAASIVEFLPEETKVQVIEGSSLIGTLVTYYSWWLALPVVLIFHLSHLSFYLTLHLGLHHQNRSLYYLLCSSFQPFIFLIISG